VSQVSFLIDCGEIDPLPGQMNPTGRSLCRTSSLPVAEG
jgi:hypothetical protein